MNHRKLADSLKTLTVLAVTTAIGFLLEELGLPQTNIITVYILGVLVIAALTSSRWYSVTASLASILLFNYIFTAPMFAFKADDAATQLTLLITFLAAILTSSYTVQIKENARRSQQNAYRTNVILDTGKMLQRAGEAGEILSITASQLNLLLKRDIACFEIANQEFLPLKFFTEGSPPSAVRGPSPDTPEEKSAARRCFLEARETGASTDILPTAAFHYLPVRSEETVYAVMAIRQGDLPFDEFQKSLTLAIIGQCAMALEKEFISRKREEEASMRKTEQLRSNLLRSISHDLRTPLTSISGNAGMLLNDGGNLDEKQKARVYSDIYDDSMWLINLVENLLSITRMEGQSVALQMETELLEEVIDEAMRHINRRHESHTIEVKQEKDFILAAMDARLIIQVITNLVDNAIKYTPQGSTITVTSCQSDGNAVIEVRDNGPGIPDELKEKIFEMFYTTGHRSADGKRGMGLGLPLCRAILHAHKGAIQVLDNTPAGSIFRLTLPAKEVSIHE
ncbi:MAG: DUF4118 domain-containing protein [Clostridium sp.]|nr:DUF4118 domain-containing protein [Clostridium sp.]